MKSETMSDDEILENREAENLRILLVDDDESFLELAERRIKAHAELEIVTCSNPEDASRIVEDKDVECVVSDYKMPEMNGVELLKKMKRTHPELPFMMLTSYVNEEVISEAISEGAEDYYSKDNGLDNPELLVHRIKTAIVQNRGIDSVDEGICILDSGGKFLVANKHFEELTGYTQRELRGEKPEILNAEELVKMEKEIAENREIECSDGTTVEIEDYLLPIELKNGSEGNIAIIKP